MTAVYACFNPRPLCRERLIRPKSSVYASYRFNPRPLCRERHDAHNSGMMWQVFQSTPPMQGATQDWTRDNRTLWFQSTPPMQGATYWALCLYIIPEVSIHAPYAGSDTHQGLHCAADSIVSIHAPYAGNDSNSLCVMLSTSQFQSTPPMQGATFYAFPGCRSVIGFNPRPLCRERRGVVPIMAQRLVVSIHAPYAGSDERSGVRRSVFVMFQSTPPMQGATLFHASAASFSVVSIHAPYAGSDVFF